MKKQIPGFLSGVLATLLVGSLSVGALAATGRMTITVDPINIQVNGQTFQPKDEQGNDVPVFAYNGTTYAPLRALAEAYGLTVGYDQDANMATVGEATPTDDTTAVTDAWSDDDDAAYQEFKGLWDVVQRPSASDPNQINYGAIYRGTLTDDELMERFNGLGEERFEEFCVTFSKDLSEQFQVDIVNCTFTSGVKRFCKIIVEAGKTTFLETAFMP